MGGGGSSRKKDEPEEQQDDDKEERKEQEEKQGQQEQADDASLSEFQDDASGGEASDESAEGQTASGNGATVPATAEATPPKGSDETSGSGAAETRTGEDTGDDYSGRYGELAAAIDDLVSGEASDPAALAQQLLQVAVATRQAPDPTAAEVLDAVLDQTTVSDPIQDELVGAVDAAETADRSTAAVLETYLQGRHTTLREELRDQLLLSEDDTGEEEGEDETVEETVLPMQVRLGNGARENVLEDLSDEEPADQVAKITDELDAVQPDSPDSPDFPASLSGDADGEPDPDDEGRDGASDQADTDGDGDGDGVGSLPAFEEYEPGQEYDPDESTGGDEAMPPDPEWVDDDPDLPGAGTASTTGLDSEPVVPTAPGTLPGEDEPPGGDGTDAEASADADGPDHDGVPSLTDDDLPSRVDLDTLHPAVDREMLREAKAAETTADFARAVFPETVQAPWVRSGESTAPQAFPIAEDGQEDRYGGFPEYDPDDVDNWNSVDDDDNETAGVRGRFMEWGDVSSAEGYDSSRVYAVQYGVEDVDPDGEVADRLPGFTDRGPPLDWTDGPSNNQRHREMAMYAACDALGVDVARHTYDAATDRVIKEGAGRGQTMQELSDAPDDWLQQVDSRELLDHIAVQVLFGNHDLNPGNIGIIEDGTVAMYDFDHAIGKHDNVLSVRRMAEYPARLADENGIDGIDPDQVTFRAIEIALAVEVAGQTETVGESVEAYDELFTRLDRDVTNLNHANMLRNNLFNLAREATDELELHLGNLTWPPNPSN